MRDDFSVLSSIVDVEVVVIVVVVVVVSQYRNLSVLDQQMKITFKKNLKLNDLSQSLIIPESSIIG